MYLIISTVPREGSTLKAPFWWEGQWAELLWARQLFWKGFHKKGVLPWPGKLCLKAAPEANHSAHQVLPFPRLSPSSLGAMVPTQGHTEDSTTALPRLSAP